MKVWYSIEAQMYADKERNYDLDEAIGSALGFVEEDIDERETYNLTALFSIEKSPSEMRNDVRKVLDEHPEIYYIDVMYRYDCENVPDRFVAWKDGTVKEYIGRIIFEEEKAHE